MRIRHACGHSIDHEIDHIPYRDLTIAARALAAQDCETCSTERVCAVCRRAFPLDDDQPHILAIDLRHDFMLLAGSYGQQHTVCAECGRATVDAMTHLFDLYVAMPDEMRLMAHKFMLERMRYGEGAFRSRLRQWGSDHLPLPHVEPLISGVVGSQRFT